MPELTLKLTIDPKTGKKTLVADYHSDADALPHEHEDEHRRLVRKLVEGLPLDGSGDIIVERESESAADVEHDDRNAERETVEQKG